MSRHPLKLDYASPYRWSRPFREREWLGFVADVALLLLAAVIVAMFVATGRLMVMLTSGEQLFRILS